MRPSCRETRLTDINFAYSVRMPSFSKRSVCPSRITLTLHWLQMERHSVCAWREGGCLLLYACWWIAENVLDASLCFVFVTLAGNLPGDTGGALTRSRSLGTFLAFWSSFQRGQMQQVRHLYVVLSEGDGAETDTEQRDRCRERNSRRTRTQLYTFYLLLFFKSCLSFAPLRIHNSLKCRSSWPCWTSWLTFCLW